MPTLFRAACLLCALALAACAATTRPLSAPSAPVILISIDGFRADYFDRGLTPTLAALASDGVHAKAMRSSFPTLTFPNHYTLVTGLYPDHHGIVNNTMVDATLGRFSIGNQDAVRDGRWWDGGEPIWVTADKQGLRTGTMFWPGSEAQIRGYRPDYYAPYDGHVGNDQRVDKVLAWLDLPADQRPRFLTLYFDAVDHAGHEHGPDSAQVDAALREVDAAIGRLVAELKKRQLDEAVNLVVVSDHGMTGVAQERTVLIDDIVDPAWLDIVTAGVVTGVNPKPGHAAEAESRLLAAHDHVQCWRKSEIPARLHYGTNARIPAIVCVAADGWMFETRQYLARPNRHAPGGEHGYDNADPNMAALFVAHGPAFKRGLLVPEFDNVDVYPLLARLLGIRPAPNDGNPATTAGFLR